MEPLDWTDTRAILQEVEKLFQRDDDVRDVQDTKKMIKEIDSHSGNSLKDAKEIIKQYTNAVAQKEKEILAPPESVHAANLDVYKAEKENLGSQIEQLREIVNTKRENITKMASQAIILKERSSECSAGSQLADSRTAYALSLYAKISNISWDYKAPDTRLAGTIGRDDLRTIESFDIDTTTLTPFQLSNKLWDMIGDGVCEDF